MKSASELYGSVDFGILTIRTDEYTAVLRHFPDRETAKGHAYYECSRVPTDDGREVSVAVARCLEQGHGPAHEAARDLIDDLAPAWILLVGIAGGIADDDYSLGDVLLANRIYDFSVSAEIQDQELHRREWNVAGGPVHPDVGALLAAIPGWGQKLKGWNRQDVVGMKRPSCEVPSDLNSDRFYGPASYRAKIQGSLSNHFRAGKRGRPPRYTVIPVGSANILAKDTDLIAEWRQNARSLGFVEMEAGGVYRAARRPDREYPVLVIRGLSDIVGFKRGAEWTSYACRSAAAFAAALIRSGVVVPGIQSKPGHSRSTKARQARDGQAEELAAPPSVAPPHSPDSAGGADPDAVRQNTAPSDALDDRRLRDLARQLPDMAAELECLRRLLRVDALSCLRQMRYSSEKVLRTVCAARRMSWDATGKTPERMIDELAADGVLPGSQAIQLRTICATLTQGFSIPPRACPRCRRLQSRRFAIF